MRVIVTRPGPQAGKWVQAFRNAGMDALSLPLINICPVTDPEPVAAAWRSLLTNDALMFVSANAVEHFFGLRPESIAMDPTRAGPRYWATGPGTVAALLAAGVVTEQIDAPDVAAVQFDSEALWQVVQSQVCSGWRVTVVRGNTEAEQPDGGLTGKGLGRDWLAEQLSEKGVEVEFVVAYERCAPVLQPGAVALVQFAAADASVWLFSSSEAVSNLLAIAAGVQWGSARAVTTHARIAAAAREAGFGVVCESRPDLAALIASIESLT